MASGECLIFTDIAARKLMEKVDQDTFGINYVHVKTPANMISLNIHQLSPISWVNDESDIPIIIK